LIYTYDNDDWLGIGGFVYQLNNQNTQKMGFSSWYSKTKSGKTVMIIFYPWKSAKG
jgi:hypothetical protein